MKISELDELIAGALGTGGDKQGQRRRNSMISQRKYYRKKLKMVTLITEKKAWIARNEKVRANNARLVALLRQAEDLVAQHIQAEAAMHMNLHSITSSLFSNQSLTYQQRPLQLALGFPGHPLHTHALHQRASVPTVPYLLQLDLLNLHASVETRRLPPALNNFNISSLSLQHRILLAQRLLGNASISDLLLEQALYGNSDSHPHNDPRRYPDRDNSHL